MSPSVGDHVRERDLHQVHEQDVLHQVVPQLVHALGRGQVSEGAGQAWGVSGQPGGGFGPSAYLVQDEAR